MVKRKSWVFCASFVLKFRDAPRKFINLNFFFFFCNDLCLIFFQQFSDITDKVKSLALKSFKQFGYDVGIKMCTTLNEHVSKQKSGWVLSLNQHDVFNQTLNEEVKFFELFKICVSRQMKNQKKTLFALQHVCSQFHFLFTALSK